MIKFAFKSLEMFRIVTIIAVEVDVVLVAIMIINSFSLLFRLLIVDD